MPDTNDDNAVKLHPFANATDYPIQTDWNDPDQWVNTGYPEFGTQYVLGDELSNTPDVTMPDPLDYMDKRLDKFFTAWIDKTRPIAKRLPANNPGYLTGGRGDLAAINYIETTGNLVNVYIYDGQDTTAPLFWTIQVPPNGVGSIQFTGEVKPHFEHGLFLVFVGVGVIKGNIFIAQNLAI